MIKIAIDGPAGSGKSTTAKLLAKRMGINYMDTGATYRAVAYALIKRGIDISDHDAVRKILDSIDVKVIYTSEGQRVLVDGEEVTVGEDSTYTFTDVIANHTIHATFKPEQSQPEPEPEQPSAPDSSFTEPQYYPDYDEDEDSLPPVDGEAPEETRDLYMVTCRTLNVRLGGGTGYARIGTLSRGTLVSGELEDGWLKFAYDGGTAYCSADYLARVDGDLTDMHVTCRTLNVRAGAGTNFEILGTLSRGTEVEILDVLNGWYKIEYLGGEAYVSAAYIG